MATVNDCGDPKVAAVLGWQTMLPLPICRVALLRRHAQQHVVEAFDEARRIRQGTAFSQQGLIEENIRPIVEFRFFVLQTLYQRVIRIDFQNRLGVRCSLSGSLEHAHQVARQFVLIRHQAGRRIGQTEGHAHVLGLVGQRSLHLLDQILELGLGLFVLLLLGFVFQRTEIEAALGHRSQFLAVEVLQEGQHPFVDAIGQQQDFHAFLAEDFQMRAVLGGMVILAGDVVDLVLAFLHAPDVIGERSGCASDSLCVEAKRNSLAIRSLLAASSPMPSFSTWPNSVQKPAYLSFCACASLLANSSSRLSTRLVEPSRIALTSRDSCRISRETFSGRSAESITPLTKRRYTGISCSASSMMNTRLTYSLIPPRLLRSHMSNGARVGMYSSWVYSLRPSTRLCV